MSAPVRPVLLLTFANDRQHDTHYLRNLPEEARKVEDALVETRADAILVPSVHQSVTGGQVEALFARFAGRVAVFHFGGHAGSFALLVEDRQGAPAPLHAAGLADFLGMQEGLRLVFLNGCSTEAQVEGLLAAGVPAVVATLGPIGDAVATEFAAAFYRFLGCGHSFQFAYDLARHALRMRHGDDPRALYCGGSADATAAGTDRWPWVLRTKAGCEAVLETSLADLAESPRQ